jgi:Ni/Fe-hydrogenase subunit HybB-like protein
MTAAETMAARTDEDLLREEIDDPILTAGEDDDALTERLLRPIWTGGPLFAPLLVLTGLGTIGLFAALAYTVTTGIGTWGNDVPVGWALGIVDFVWWIGIGHAGTFISAILLLLQARWRTSINRIAEAMTLFALINAALFPLAHLGRPWFAYWLLPYPSTMGVWPQFRSALPWDAAAIATYGTVSFCFWYLGLIPDLAAARDAAPERWRRQVYGVFALGWRGSAHQWHHHRIVYGLLAGLATPLVVSVHTIVSFDFAITQLPGWHSPIFPPFFVAGAIYSGFAMVVVLLVPLRAAFRLHDVITTRHLESAAKMLLVTGWIVTYAYAIETFVAWYGGDPHERFLHLVERPTGLYAAAYWGMLVCNCAVVQVLWFRRMRRSAGALFAISILVVIGMWLERFVLIVGAQARDFLPSSWRDYAPSWVDVAILCGTLSFFAFAFLLFVRFVPFVPTQELKELRRALAEEEARDG